MYAVCTLVHVSLLTVAVIAQVPEKGKCPDVEVQKDFDPTKYFGKWYEIAKFYTSFETGQKCNTATYTPKVNGHFTVYNTGLDSSDKEVNATGDAYSPDENEKAKIKVQFSEKSPYADYWVLDTDYETYTLIYSCINILDVTHLDFSWILSRKPTLDPEIKARLFQKVESYGIKSKNYKDDDQLSCPWNIY
ncbi:apolipoprotein D-like [Mercenaria mercenaria]|uniref:apolipoprotein D-like n=1 Tax=Mercenaria mercenaria TaxID=6596 RepID=UPI00234ED67B|nr:apolipoprotein D-like [Mercenaria mercenaria]